MSHQLLVATGDHFSFRHALGHEAVYRDTLPGERAELHERIAVALTGRRELALGGDHAVAAAELAHHWHAAGRLTESLAASVVAGQAAEAADAPIEAHMHYRRAIELWPRVVDAAASARVDRTWLLEHAAETSSLAGSHHGAVQLVDQLLAEIDPEREPERHARVLVRRALFLWYAGDAATSKRATAELRERAEAGLTLAEVTRLCAVANQSSLELRYVDALMLARDAMAAAGQVGGQADVGFSLHILGSLESHLGCYDAAVERLEQSLAISRELADPQRVGSTWHNLAEVYVYAGRPAEAVAVAERGIVELQRLGLNRTFAALTAGQLTFALLALGRWDEADRCSREVIAGEAQPYFAVPVKLGRLHLLVRQGRFDEVEPLLADLRTNFGDYDYMAGVCALWEAELAVWLHGWHRARSNLERAYTVMATSDEIGLELRLVALAVRLEADEFAWARLTAAPRDRAAAQGAADARIRHAEEFLARIESVTECCSLPFRRLLDLARAERTRLDETADPSVWAAIAAHAGHDTYLAAYAHWREADTLLAATTRPDRAHAQSLVHSAYEAATALGAGPLSAAVADLAMRARIELVLAVPDPTIDDEPGDLDAHGLTRRELDVLRLLGDGLSNREIGEALFISAKTASVHVTHILQKLNVTTRVQAALAADRLAGHSALNNVVK